MVSQSGSVARTVQDANNHKLTFIMHVIDGVVAGKRDTQARRKIVARRCRQRKMEKRLAIAFDLIDEAFRRRFGSFDGDIKPNLGKVGFGRVG